MSDSKQGYALLIAVVSFTEQLPTLVGCYFTKRTDDIFSGNQGRLDGQLTLHAARLHVAPWVVLVDPHLQGFPFELAPSFMYPERCTDVHI